MKDLRSRLIALATAMALLGALACIIAADIAARHGLRQAEERSIAEGLVCTQRQINDLLAVLRFEVTDYAQWDEMYAHMPLPAAAWAETNLARGGETGSLGQVFVTCHDGRVTGRFREHDQRGATPAPGDLAAATALAALCQGDAVRVGVAALNGHPALVALSPVLHSDKSGPPRGYLMDVAYFTPDLLNRFDLHGFTMQVSVVTSVPFAATDTIATGLLDIGRMSEPRIVRDNGHLVVESDMPVVDGVLRLTLTMATTATTGWDGLTLIAIAGLGTAMVASAIGSLLGWWWLRPITRLAAVCRQGSRSGGRIRLPTASGLIEADTLANEINRLLEADEQAHQRLAESLGREASSHAAQRRFLSGLGHELGQPLHRLVAIAQQAEMRGGNLPPEALEGLRAGAEALESRLQEIMGWSPDERPVLDAGSEQSLAAYLQALGDQLRPLAASRGLTLSVVAPQTTARIPGRLMSPVLVNLAANALRATATGGVTIRVEHEARDLVWTVVDTGPGLPPELAERLRHACAQGGISPGSPGFGLGLTLVLANVRALDGSLELTRNGPDGATFTVRIPLSGGAAHSGG